MKNVSKRISCYSADTAGICSALYELGGLTVVHDASGCNSTYSTHDEPRWFDMPSRIFISALTEADAVMGNDEKLISDTVKAAKDLKPEFIALCGSPMPMMTGVDFDAIAQEVERRTNLPTFGFSTNGMATYLEGTSEAFYRLSLYFSEKREQRADTVNILGATPLDFGLNGSVEAIKSFLRENDFKVGACLSMGASLNDFRILSEARVNLVISQSGVKTAKYLYDEYEIPYVCAVPVGKFFSKQVLKALEDPSEQVFKNGSGSEVCIIGEGIYSKSLASELLYKGIDANMISPLETDKGILSQNDAQVYSEEDIRAYLKEKKPKTVIADPLYSFVIPKGTKHYHLAHFAFSGRCYTSKILNFIDREIDIQI